MTIQEAKAFSRYGRVFRIPRTARSFLLPWLALICAGTMLGVSTAEAQEWWEVPVEPAVRVMPSGGQPQLQVTEGSGGASVRVALSTVPTSTVTISFVSDGQVVADVPLRTIRPDQWQLGFDVRVQALADGLIEGPHMGTLQMVVSSSGADYDGLAVTPIDVGIVDADHAGVVVEPDAVDVGEGGPSVPMRIRLAARPTTPVTVWLTPPTTQVSLDRTQLQFTPGNWNQAQVVTVTAVNDGLHERATTTTSIAVATAGVGSTPYDGLNVDPIPTRVYDDDPAGYQLTAPDIIQLDEARSATLVDISMHLTSEPTAPVTVTARELTGQVRLGNAVLTFTAQNWSRPQRITVSAVDDRVVEPRPHVASVAFDISSRDTDYLNARIAARPVHIQDDDTASVTTDAPSTLQLAEGRPGQQVHVRFGSAPQRDMVVRPRVDPAGQVQISPAAITVRAGEWASTGIAFDVTAADDDVDETDSHVARIDWLLETDDTSYNGMTTVQTPVQITDDDTASVRVTPAGAFDTVEGGPQREIEVQLTSAPIARVVVTVTGDAQATAVGPTRTFRFDAQNWNVPQRVAIAARLDDLAEASPHTGQVTFVSASTDPRYDGLAVAPIQLNIRDDDQPGVITAHTGADTRVNEAGLDDVVDVRLRSRPAAAVTVTFDTADDAVRFTPSSITIEPATWNQQHLAAVSATQNDALDGTRTVRLPVAIDSDDPSYATSAPAPEPLVVTIVDDERAGLTLTPTGADTLVREGAATDTYALTLAARPSSDVTIELQPDAQVAVDPSTLTFTASDWKQPRIVTVRAVQDDIDETDAHTGVIRHTARTTAAGWAGATIPDLGVRVMDDDTSAISFEATGGSTRVTEGGAGDTVRMVLTSRPTGSVEVRANADRLLTISGSLTFDASNWNTPRTLTIGAVDDEDAQGEHIASITFTVNSPDRAYRSQAIPPLDVTIVDNDRSTTDDEAASERSSTSQDTTIVPRDIPPDGPLDGATPSTPPPAPLPRDARAPDTASGSPTTAASATGDAAPTASTLAAPASDDGGVAGGTTLERSAARTPSADAPRASIARRGPNLGQWMRKHAVALAIGAGMLGVGGLGGGWAMRRNPARMARRIGKGIGNGRL